MLSSLSAPAQEADSVRFRVTYEADYTYTAGDSLKGDDVMHLDIGERSSHFYSKLFARQEEIRDSMNRRGSVSITMFNKATTGLEAGQMYDVFKNIPVQGRLTYMEQVLMDHFKYEEDMPQMNWTILDGDTLIAGYKCNKAKAKLRGREWTVWFTPDIPVQDGPWKLCGLPGLILWATDTSGIFSFSCIGIEQLNGVSIAMKKKKYTECTPEKMNKIQSDFHENPVRYMSKALSHAIWIDATSKQNGKEKEDEEYNLLEYYDAKRPR